MNILLTCAGRRNYLVQYFKEALGASGSVFAADCSAQAPAMQEADKAFIVPRVDAPIILIICFNYAVITTLN